MRFIGWFYFNLSKNETNAPHHYIDLCNSSNFLLPPEEIEQLFLFYKNESEKIILLIVNYRLFGSKIFKDCKIVQRFLHSFSYRGSRGFIGPTTVTLHKGLQKPCYATGTDVSITPPSRCCISAVTDGAWLLCKPATGFTPEDHEPSKPEWCKWTSLLWHTLHRYAQTNPDGPKKVTPRLSRASTRTRLETKTGMNGSSKLYSKVGTAHKQFSRLEYT